jgi:hypothetical protein
VPLNSTFAGEGKKKMGMWKGGLTTEQVAEKVLRDYLVRCHRLISKNYPKIAHMDPTEAADHLLRLRDSGSIKIQLYSRSPSSIGCRIIELRPDQ